jgi:nitrogen fixation protein NifB
VLVYEPHPRQAQAFQLKEIRQTPASGSGEARWAELANTLSDCRAFLVVAAGSAPRRVLTAHGVRVIEMEGLIEEGLRAVYADQPIPPTMARRFMGCSKGVSCRGTGTGCG